MTMITLIWFMLCAILSKGVLSLRDVFLSMPEGVKLGQAVTMSCSFQLEGDTLYTVKWYKFQDEFYRYTPKENPPTKFFSVQGISESAIDKSLSNGTQLTLRRMTEEMSGLYSCEVSADAPSFQTATVSRNIMVIEPPKDKPVIAGLKSRYRLGEAIHVNCTAPGSRPAANITWLINGHTPDHKHVDERRRMVDGDLDQKISTLKIHARPLHFPGGRMRLSCTASVFQIYLQSVEKIFTLEGMKTHHSDHLDIGLDVPRGYSPSLVGDRMHRHTPLPPTEGLIEGDEYLEVNGSGCSASVQSILILTLAAASLATFRHQ